LEKDFEKEAAYSLKSNCSHDNKKINVIIFREMDPEGGSDEKDLFGALEQVGSQTRGIPDDCYS